MDKTRSDQTALFGSLVDAIGTASFAPALLDLIRSRVGVDQVMVFTYSDREGFGCPIIHGDMARKIAETLGRNYADRYHRLDPNLGAIVHQPEQARFIPFDLDRIASAQYRNLFFERANLCDKYSLLFSRHGLTFYCNFYRLTRSGSYAREDLLAIESLTPLLTSSIQQHAYSIAGPGERHEVPAPPAAPLRDGEPLEFTLDDLSERENAVCQRIFMGLSNEAIALDLALSVHTVRTYRQRLYKKAGVTNVNELYARFSRAYRYR